MKLSDVNQALLPNVACADCGASMVLRDTKRFRYGNGDKRLFWACSQWPACRGSHGAHPDGRPLGVPASGATKSARIRTHEALDEWMECNHLDRPEAYARLEDEFRSPIHIGELDLNGCENLIAYLKATTL